MTRRHGCLVRLYVAADGKPAGLIAVADPLKTSTAEVVSELKRAGLTIIMVTGDNSTTAKAVASRLGIAFEADVLPERKAEVVKSYQNKGHVVGMAGDGVNDAPALAAADVGIAMVTGTDVAMEAGGITLLKGDLRAILRARHLSMATMRNIRQNLFFAFVEACGYEPLRTKTDASQYHQRHRMNFPRHVFFLSFLLGLSLLSSSAQQGSPNHSMGGTDMPSAQTSSHKQMGGMSEMLDQMHPKTFIQEVRHHATSGTSAEPNSVPAPMLMSMKGNWRLMFHGNAFVVDTQQSSPRGGDKLFSTNWFMPMAQRSLGPGQLTLRAMFSLEPATVTDRRYPLLFQQGETAYGVPIADGQHPHDFFMELAALYDLPIGERNLLTFYAAPVGDPAIGPTAYPHRASASENPVGTLGHHQEDSTHIANDVVTVGFSHRIVRLEMSGFHGREPDEFRWNIDQGKIDSWSTRLTVQPGQNWSGQFSYGRIASPEALSPSEDQARTTASVMYNKPFQHGNWASTAIWGRTRSLEDSAKENSYLLESTVNFHDKNYASIRLENAGRTNELLVGEHPLPPGFKEEPLTHVQAYTVGYDREMRLVPGVSSAIGAQVSLYGVADPLKPIYGSDPVGVSVFIRLRPASHSH